MHWLDGIAVAAGLIGQAGGGRGVPAAPAPAVHRAASAGAAPGPAPAGDADQLVRALLLAAVPHSYEATEDWGRKIKVRAGVALRRDGWRLETYRRWREAKHGTWKKYRLWLVDPGRRFTVRLKSVPGEAGAGVFDLVIQCRLGAFGRMSEWRRGVQLISLSAEGEATVRLTFRCRVVPSLDFSELPPALLLHLSVEDARLELVDFRLKRISRLDGPVVRQLEGAMRRIVEKRLEARRADLVRRLNEQIERHQDKLRWSLQDAATAAWARALKLLELL